MMTIVLIAPRDYDLVFKSRLRALFAIKEGGSADAAAVFEGDAAAYLSRHPSTLIDEFELYIRERILSAIKTPVFYGLDYRGIALCKKVLLSIADDPDVLVDNDVGVLLPGDAFALLLRGKPDWDWLA